MNLVLIGASGFIGSALLQEALERGHAVTAVVTKPEKVQPHAHLKVVACDVHSKAELAKIMAGHEAVLSAFSGHAQKDVQGYYESGFRSILAAAKQADIRRILVVGGAGSLEIAPGKLLLEANSFPAEYQPTAQGAYTALRLLREEQELDWTMLSPAAEIFSGERTGSFRLGTEQLVQDEQGRSRISTADYAVAMLNELEHPAHSRKRFTLAY